jgi:hypothetical protein
MNAETAGHAGTPQLKQFHMVNTKMWYHPKYYKNLRKLARLRNRDQAISLQPATAASERAPGTGLKPQASSSKLQASSKPEPSSGSQASSDKRQAPGSKLQASSHKLQAQ